MFAFAALFGISSKLGYLLPAMVGVESMGIPSPGETALVLSAVLASQGKLEIWLVIVIACAAAIIGDNIGYWIARRLGREVLTAPGPLYKRRLKLIEVGDRFFDKHGAKAVFLGRWVAILRVAAAWLAGINHMPFKQFFLWNALGGITWATTVALVAYFAGDAATKAISKFGVIAAIAIGAALVVGFGYVKIRERRAERAG
jgi:membrane protein DedA with SNARE-associated domain